MTSNSPHNNSKKPTRETDHNNQILWRHIRWIEIGSSLGNSVTKILSVGVSARSHENQAVSIEETRKIALRAAIAKFGPG